MATSRERATQEREGNSFQQALAAEAIINRGAMVMLEAGLAKRAGPSTTGVCVGMAKHSANQAEGDKYVDAKLGTFAFANSATDPVADADIGKDCFIENDETISKTNNGGASIKAGTVRELDGNSVWVSFG